MMDGNSNSIQNKSPQQVSVTLIGSGGVATNIGRLLVGNGIKIQQILGRSAASTSLLAERLNCPYSLDPATLNQLSDIYIIAVQDKEIPGLTAQLKIPSTSLIVHTAGGVSIEVFKGHFTNYGVLYPLQTLRRETKELPNIPFYLDGNTQQVKSLLKAFCELASLDYHWATDQQRIELHIAAVFCSNFTNYLYSLAEQFCAAKGLHFQTLSPLIQETASRLSREATSASLLQTGPAVRGDASTLEKHMALLSGSPEAREVYQFLTAKIMDSELFKY